MSKGCTQKLTKYPMQKIPDRPAKLDRPPESDTSAKVSSKELRTEIRKCKTYISW
jgi:hypothetical protein